MSFITCLRLFQSNPARPRARTKPLFGLLFKFTFGLLLLFGLGPRQTCPLWFPVLVFFSALLFHTLLTDHFRPLFEVLSHPSRCSLCVLFKIMSLNSLRDQRHGSVLICGHKRLGVTTHYFQSSGYANFQVAIKTKKSVDLTRIQPSLFDLLHPLPSSTVLPHTFVRDL